MPSDTWLEGDISFVVFAAIDADALFAVTGDPPRVIGAKLVGADSADGAEGTVNDLTNGYDDVVPNES